MLVFGSSSSIHVAMSLHKLLHQIGAGMPCSIGQLSGENRDTRTIASAPFESDVSISRMRSFVAMANPVMNRPHG